MQQMNVKTIYLEVGAGIQTHDMSLCPISQEQGSSFI